MALAVKVFVGGCIGHVLHLGLLQGKDPKGSELLTFFLLGSLFTTRSPMLGGRLKETRGMLAARCLVFVDASRMDRPVLIIPLSA